MSKRRAGLQRKVSAIFDGVSVQTKNDDTQQTSAATSPESPNYAPPSHLDATTPKPQQSVQEQPKAEPAKQPETKQLKLNPVIKAIKQIPWQQIKNKYLASKSGDSSPRQAVTVILVPLLFIILIFVFIRVLRTPSAGKARVQSSGPSNAVAFNIDSKTDWQPPKLYPTTLRDPMQIGSATIAQTETGRLIVKGIVYSSDNPATVISNQILHEGDKISGATIVKINENSVEFEMNNKKWTQKVQR